MDCLTCIAAIYLSGALGVQNQSSYEVNRYNPYWHNTLSQPSNDYGKYIGNVSLTIELENGLFVRATHISGINTFETDNGLNALEFGAHVYLFKKN